MKIQKIRIVIVIKGVFSYCLKFRPYMAIWMFFCTLAGVCTAIQKREVFRSGHCPGAGIYAGCSEKNYTYCQPDRRGKSI